MAKEYLDFLASSFPGVETATNPSKPRRGAFNIMCVILPGVNASTNTEFISRVVNELFFPSILTSDGEEHEVWDGKSKGPPRKEKFPDKDQVHINLIIDQSHHNHFLVLDVLYNH